MGALICARSTYNARMNRAMIYPPSVAFSAIVSGAGLTAANGQYDYDGSSWSKGVFVMDKSPNWALRTGATIYYTAPVTEFPWEAIWVISTGAAPPPFVLDYASR